MKPTPAHPILAAYQALAKDVRALDRIQREMSFEIARKSEANPNGLQALQAMLRLAGSIARTIAARIPAAQGPGNPPDDPEQVRQFAERDR